MENRNNTLDIITKEAIEAIKLHKIAIKCATINPDEKKYNEKNLSKVWFSPNATIRGSLNGIIVREPILFDNIPRIVKNWKKPIIIARHAYGDLWASKEYEYKNLKTAYFVIENDNGEQEKILIRNFGNDDGVLLACFISDYSISNFASFCFELALSRKMPLYLSTKDTILKVYDGKYRNIFDQMYEKNYKEKFAAANIFYEHKLTDDMSAFSIKSEGGYIWACKNHDGDVQSNYVIQGFGSLGLMTSLIYTKENCFLSEAGHGTVTRHYENYLKVAYLLYLIQKYFFIEKALITQILLSLIK